jgi:integrase
MLSCEPLAQLVGCVSIDNGLAAASESRAPTRIRLGSSDGYRRNKIAPTVVGTRPDALFVTWQGKPRTQAAIALSIMKTVLKYVGVRMTPHQFRHLAAKIILDGIDTRRAGRAHAKTIARIKKGDPKR